METSFGIIEIQLDEKISLFRYVIVSETLLNCCESKLWYRFDRSVILICAFVKTYRRDSDFDLVSHLSNHKQPHASECNF